MDQTLYEQAVALRHQLHAHPELSGRERETQERLIAFLQENAPAVELFRRDGWFYGVYHGDPAGRRIAFRADMDALPMDETLSLPYGSQTPGVSHKCGHDGHSATLAALAAAISRTGSKNTVYFVFQPAEETGEGAMRCASLMDEERGCLIWCCATRGDWIKPSGSMQHSNCSMTFSEFMESTLPASTLAIVFHDHYERSGDSMAVIQTRASNATNRYNTL